MGGIPGDDEEVYLPLIIKPYTYGEPNDECALAYQVELDQSYEFFPEDIDDWYVFTLMSSANVQIEVNNFVPAAGQMLVYSGSCNGLILIAQDGALAVDNLLDLGNLDAGTYAIWLINDGVLNETNAYSLTVQTQ